MRHVSPGEKASHKGFIVPARPDGPDRGEGKGGTLAAAGSEWVHSFDHTAAVKRSVALQNEKQMRHAKRQVCSTWLAASQLGLHTLSSCAARRPGYYLPAWLLLAYLATSCLPDSLPGLSSTLDSMALAPRDEVAGRGAGAHSTAGERPGREGGADAGYDRRQGGEEEEGDPGPHAQTRGEAGSTRGGEVSVDDGDMKEGESLPE